MATLDQRLEESFATYSIAEDQQASLKLYLGLLRNKDVPTYEHSVRVGLKGAEVAEFTHVILNKCLLGK